MTPQELATFYLEQLREQRDGVPPAQPEPYAVDIWEDWITNDPEQAWPVFEQLLARAGDDDTLEQIWFRLRLLLHGHYDAFHGRAAELLARYQRLAAIAGPDAMDPEQYAQEPLDREALIEAYRAIYRTCDLSAQVGALARSDPERALAIVVEIIHRGASRGWDSFDVLMPLGDLLAEGGRKIIGQVEARAQESVAVRRVLWRLVPQTWMPIDPEVRERFERAAGDTTDYTELDVPVPAPQKQLDADERIIDGWFEHEKHRWAFSVLNDLIDEDAPLAWSITLDLVARATEDELPAIAAGPLEDLLRKHPDLVWPDVIEKAHTDPHFLHALRCVWVFEDDGVYHRFRELMETMDLETN